MNKTALSPKPFQAGDCSKIISQILKNSGKSEDANTGVRKTLVLWNR